MLPLLLLATVACKGDDGIDTSQTVYTPVDGPGGPAKMSFTCSPADLRSLELIIGLGSQGCAGLPGTQSWLQIDLWGQGEPLAPGEVWVLTTGNSFAAWDEHGVGDAVAGRGGSLRIVSWNAEAVSGTYEVLTEDQRAIQGAFEAAWCPDLPPCG